MDDIGLKKPHPLGKNYQMEMKNSVQ